MPLVSLAQIIRFKENLNYRMAQDILKKNVIFFSLVCAWADVDFSVAFSSIPTPQIQTSIKDKPNSTEFNLSLSTCIILYPNQLVFTLAYE